MSGSTKATVMDTSFLNFDPLTSEFTFMNVTSLNSTISSDFSQDKDFWKIAGIGLFVGLVNFLVVFGNILVFLAVFTDRALRTTTGYFIVNLAVADLLLGVVVLPFSGYQILERWDFSDIFCDIWAATDVLCSTASIYGLCCIGIDRYIGVTRPLKHHLIMTKKKTLLTIGLSWACSFGVACCPLFGWPKRDDDDSENCPMTDTVEYVMFSTSLSFYIPLVIVLIMYYRIYREVSKQTKAIKAGEKTYVIANEGASSVTLRIHVSISANRKTPTRKNFVKSKSFSQKVASFNRQKRAAKTLGIVVGAFIICWLPFFFVFPFSKMCTKADCVSTKAFNTCIWLGYCNSFLNPFIYAYSNPSFRNAFKRLLMCKCKKTGLYRSRQLALRKISNINRYTTGGGESPILSQLKSRQRCKHNNNANIGLMQLEKVSEKRNPSRRQRKDEHRDVLQHILEQEVESSLADDRTNSVHEQNYVDQRGIMNQVNTSQTELPKTQTFQLNGNIYTNGECGSTYPDDTIIESANSDSSGCDEDENSPFINNLQNRERFFDESTRIYNNFLQTRTPRPSSQKGRRPSAPSAHISVVVETVDDPKQPRRGSYFV